MEITEMSNTNQQNKKQLPKESSVRKFIKKAYNVCCRLYKQYIQTKTETELKIDNLNIDHEKLKQERRKRQKEYSKDDEDRLNIEHFEKIQDDIIKKIQLQESERLKKEDIEIALETKSLEYRLKQLEFSRQNIEKERTLKEKTVLDRKIIEEKEDLFEKECLEQEYLRREELEQEYFKKEQEIIEDIQKLNSESKDKNDQDICSFFSSVLKNL